MGEKTKGTDSFLESSDLFFQKVADYLDDYEIDKDKLSDLREICEIVKITAMTIKTLREESKTPKASPSEKLKARANGSQVMA